MTRTPRENELSYCPEDDVLRDQMAAFLTRGFLGY